MSGLVSCVAWVRRGIAERHPKKYALDENEINRVSKLARVPPEEMAKEMARLQAELANAKGDDEAELNAIDDDEDLPDAAMDAMDEDQPEVKIDRSNTDDLSAYKLDEYDDDPKSGASGAFTNIGRLTYYNEGEEDPYVTIHEGAGKDEDDEREDLEVLPTDNLIVIAKTEDEISSLEVYVYDESQENLYVHHDVGMLPAFPLCMEWLDFRSTAPSFSTQSTNPNGNFLAIGTMEPDIEIWSLDTVDPMYPDFVLGRPDKTRDHVPVPLGTGKKKKKKAKHRSTQASHHVDAVLSLSWNRSHRNLLASGSADRTIKLWDLTRDPLAEDGSGGAIRSFDMHKDKVQAVQWNSAEPTVLLTGSYDRTVRMFDTRTPDAGVGAVVGADVEVLRWDPFQQHSFMVSLESGIVVCFDARNLPSDLSSPSPPLWTLNAHDGAVSGFDINPHLPGVFVTGGQDKAVKVWNIVESGERKISMVASRDLGVGKVFSTTWSPDDPLTLAAAGTKGTVQLWDLSANGGTRRTFASKLQEAGRKVREKESAGIINVQEQYADDDSGQEDE